MVGIEIIVINKSRFIKKCDFRKVSTMKKILYNNFKFRVVILNLNVPLTGRAIIMKTRICVMVM